LDDYCYESLHEAPSPEPSPTPPYPELTAEDVIGIELVTVLLVTVELVTPELDVPEPAGTSAWLTPPPNAWLKRVAFAEAKNIRKNPIITNPMVVMACRKYFAPETVFSMTAIDTAKYHSPSRLHKG
jgi:hypothetical protein